MSEHESRLGKSFKINLDSHSRSMQRLIDVNNLSVKDSKKVYRHLSDLKINSSWHCFRTNQGIEWALENLYLAYIDAKMYSLLNKRFLISLLYLKLPNILQNLLNKILPKI